MAPEARRDFPWWLVVAGLAGAWLLLSFVTDEVYAAILATLSRGIGVTIFVTLVAFAFSGLALLFVPSLTPLMLGRGEEVTQAELAQICQILLLLLPFQLGTNSGLYYLQILKRSTLYTTIQTAKLIFEVALNFVLIGSMGLGVYGFLLSMLAGEIVTSVALCAWILWTLRPRIDWGVLPPILTYAAAGKVIDVATIMDGKKLSDEHANTIGLVTQGDKIWGIPYKADVKSTIWYPIKAFQAKGYAVPKTWDELIALSDKIVADGANPWCISAGGPGDATRTVVQHLFEAAFQNFFQFGAASAMAWVLFAVILVFSVLQFRLLRGHTEY